MTQEAIAISTTPPLPGLQLVQQANDALATIATDFAGSTDPGGLAGPYMTWADTANGLIKRRNEAGSDWIVEGALFRQSLSAFPLSELPATDEGDVLVPGAGIHSFKYGAYAPNSLPARHRSGGNLTHTTNTVTVAAGKWRGADDDVDLVLAASLSKTLQTSGAWAAGAGANGLFSGAAAVSTWYHVFVIRNDSTGAVDVGFDTSVTAANRPSGWTAYRRAGSVYNQAAGGILPFVQNGSLFRYLIPVRNLSNVGLGAPSLATVTTPAGVQCIANLSLVLTAQSTYSAVFVYSPDETDRAFDAMADVWAGVNFAGAASLSVVTNTSSQVYARATGSIPAGAYLNTVSYTDFIGS